MTVDRGFGFHRYPGVAKVLKRQAAEQQRYDAFEAQRALVNDENVRRLREYTTAVHDAHARGQLPPDKPATLPTPPEPFNIVERRRDWRRDYLAALVPYLDVARATIATELAQVETESRTLRDKLAQVEDHAQKLGGALAELDMAALRNGQPLATRKPAPIAMMSTSTPVLDGRLLGADSLTALFAENRRPDRSRWPVSNSFTYKNLSVVLTGRSFGLASTLHSAAGEVAGFGKAVDGANVGLSKFALLARGGAAAGALAVVLALKAAISSAAGFQTQMQNVNSISYLSNTALDQLGKQVISLSKTLPQSATVLAAGLYDIASSGFQGADGLTVLKASAEAASAGLTDTATSAQAITAVLNAYGLSADKAGAVSDALFQTVNLGVVTFEQLAGTIGDVVGIAATAGVDINQIGSAIATMTLSGISAAEAGTSLNRVIQTLITPSKSLSAVYKQLGYESGLTALQTKGLHGVMEDLQKVTGGNAEAMLALFPDIRAARGALALLSQQGQLYTKISSQIDDANTVQGATHRALAEQAKAASYQFHLFINDITAGAITLGEKLLPVLVAAMHDSERLASRGIGALQDASRALGPTWRALHQAGLDVLSILGDLYHAGEPAVKVLAALGGAAVIGALNTLATVLQAVTGFLSHHEAVAAALAAVYIARLIPALVGAARSVAETAYLRLLYALDAVRGGAASTAGKVKSLGSAFTGANIAAGAFTLGIFAITGVLQAMSNDASKAKEAASKLTEGFDPANLDSARKSLDGLRASADAAFTRFHAYDNAGGTAENVAQLFSPFNKNTVDEALNNAAVLGKTYKDLQQQVFTVQENAQAAAAKVGLLTTRMDYGYGGVGDKLIRQFADLAKSSGIDLTKPVDQSGDAVAALAAKWQELHDTAGGTLTDMANKGQIDIATLQEMTKAITDAGDAAGKSFTSASDIIGSFSLKATAKELTAAQKAATSAQQKLNAAQKAQDQLQARLAGKRKLSVAQQQQLTNSQDKLTTATENAKQAQQDLADTTEKAAHPDQQYRQFLTDQLKQAQDFVTGVADATRRGLNQNTVAQLIAAGPKDAAPVLAAIAADQSGNLIALVNQTQQTLDSLNQQTVEDARLTQQAIQASTDQMSKDLADALSISNLEISSGGLLTAAEVAAKLGLSPSVAQQIGDEFGITFAQAAASSIAANATWSVYASQVPKAAQAQPPGSTYRSQVPQYAGGGLAAGPGTSTSDSILARISKGEFIARAKAVAYYGPGYFEALNALRLPRYATGGYYGGGGSTTTHNIGQQVGQIDVHVNGGDPNAILRALKRKARLASLSGGRVGD